MKQSIVLIAGYKSSTTNYIRFFSSLQAKVHTLSDYLHPSKNTLCCKDILHLSFDLLVLPGGGDICPAFYKKEYTEARNTDYALDLLQFQLLQKAVLCNKPVLGICKGMQLIQIFFGGSLIPHLTSAAIHGPKDKIHPVIFSLDNPCDRLPSYLLSWQRKLILILSELTVVNSAHHQGVSKPCDSFLCIHQGPDQIAETILHKAYPILGLQWHPERFFAPGMEFYRLMLTCLLSGTPGSY